MKKLSLKPNAFDKGEVLTRAQLKKVMGGTGSGDTGSGACSSTCLAVGSECGTAEAKGRCEWVEDPSCPGGGWSGCFIPFG
ncbi:hypothetical protein ACS5PU_08625 [Pedobacter sp. GSP4]|uniref:hypothetical protein n=1 Tax=Pedobacter sp. GSP4 TaxID=3453716 RepID=UPI003EEF65E7